MKLSIKPGSFWLAYSVTNLAVIQNMIPSHLQLSPVKLLHYDEQPDFKLMFNCYSLRSSWMTGNRVDIQTFAENKITKSKHLVVLDVLSNTLDWNPQTGINMANANIKTNIKSDRDKKTNILLDPIRLNYRARSKNDILSFNATTWGKVMKPDWDFVVEANRECFFRTHPKGIKMKFDEDNINTNVHSLKTIDLLNTLWMEYREDNPTHAIMHGHPMNFDVNVKFPM